jgi:hypothetical protein
MPMRPSRGRRFRPEVACPAGAINAGRGRNRAPQGLRRICGQAGTVCVVGRVVMPELVG